MTPSTVQPGLKLLFLIFSVSALSSLLLPKCHPTVDLQLSCAHNTVTTVSGRIFVSLLGSSLEPLPSTTNPCSLPLTFHSLPPRCSFCLVPNSAFCNFSNFVTSLHQRQSCLALALLIFLFPSFFHSYLLIQCLFCFPVFLCRGCCHLSCTGGGKDHGLPCWESHLHSSSQPPLQGPQPAEPPGPSASPHSRHGCLSAGHCWAALPGSGSPGAAVHWGCSGEGEKHHKQQVRPKVN